MTTIEFIFAGWFWVWAMVMYVYGIRGSNDRFTVLVLVWLMIVAYLSLGTNESNKNLQLAGWFCQ